MSTILTVPASLDDASFESMLQVLADLPPDATKVVVDARHTRWASPYGLVALLTLFQSLPEKPQFIPPEDHNTLSYWARSGFFRHAEKLVEYQGLIPKSRSGDSNYFLEITPIAQTEDVQHVVQHIQDRSAAIMETLGFPPSGAVGFSVVLSESCQNIIEHAGGPGWVAVQTYDWTKRLGRRVVVIAVSDAGLGFRRSLEPTRGTGNRWDDGAALEAAVLRATSRFHDPGRGQGIAGIKRYVGKWNAKFTIRSGTARIGILPAWQDDREALVENLPSFPGAQMQIIIPQSLPADA